MKKRIFNLLVALMLIPCMVLIAACGKKTPETDTVDPPRPDPSTYTVTLTQGTGYTLAAKSGSTSPVTSGGDFTFVFTLASGYNQSTPTVKVNNAAVTLAGGEYTITNITANQTVTVEGVVANPHSHSYGTPTAVTGKPWQKAASCTCGDTKTETDYRWMDNEDGMIALFDELTYDGNYKISVTASTSGGLDYTGDIEVNGKNSYADFPNGSTEVIYERYMQNIDETTTTEWYYNLSGTWNIATATYNTWNYYGGGIILTKKLTADNFDASGEYSTPASYFTVYTVENCEITFNQNNILIVMDTVGSGWSAQYEFTITLGTSTLTEQDIFENVDHPSLMFGIMPDEFNGYANWVFYCADVTAGDILVDAFLDKLEKLGHGIGARSDSDWDGYDKVGVYILEYSDSYWVEFNDTNDGVSNSYGYRVYKAGTTYMMFGIVPTYFDNDGSGYLEWYFANADKYDDFITFLTDGDWITCTDHTADGCNGWCKEWDDDASAPGTVVGKEDDKIWLILITADKQNNKRVILHDTTSTRMMFGMVPHAYSIVTGDTHEWIFGGEDYVSAFIELLQDEYDLCCDGTSCSTCTKFGSGVVTASSTVVTIDYETGVVMLMFATPEAGYYRFMFRA